MYIKEQQELPIDWTSLAREVLERDGLECQMCGQTEVDPVLGTDWGDIPRPRPPDSVQEVRQ